MKLHKWQKEIIAWADGAEIEEMYMISSPYSGNDTNKIVKHWKKVDFPSWYLNAEYRIKPEPKPDIVSYLDVTADDIFYTDEANANLKVSIDRETGKLKSAEVLK